MCVSGMLPNTRREGKGFFAEKQANRGRIFLLSENNQIGIVSILMPLDSGGQKRKLRAFVVRQSLKSSCIK